METLLEIAKRLGIQPNPYMSKKDWESVCIKIGQELAKTPTGLPVSHPKEKYRFSHPLDLPNNLYHVRKRIERNWSIGTQKKLLKIMRNTYKKDVFAHVQVLGFQTLEETPFIHHQSYSRTKDVKERFVADIDLASPYFPALVKKMDNFISKHNAQFKIASNRALNRTDTLNVYMQEDITPEIAKEFYTIVKPCLCEEHHDKLDGLEIMVGSKPLKGIKIGPELNEDMFAYLDRKKWVNQNLTHDIHSPELRENAENYLEKLIGHSSLGEKACALQLMDLMYYCMDKGKSPFHYIAYDGSFYDKHINMPDLEEKDIIKAPKRKSFWKQLKRLFQKKEVLFDWKDPKKWHDVMVQNSNQNEINFGHRIKISDLTEKQRDQIREGLQKLHIVFTERQATKKSEGVKIGDWTIRVTDPKSVEQLRSIAFCWATGPGTRPVTMKKEIFEQQQEQLKKLSGRSSEIGSVNSKRSYSLKEINQSAFISKKRELDSNSG